MYFIATSSLVTPRRPLDAGLFVLAAVLLSACVETGNESVRGTAEAGSTSLQIVNVNELPWNVNAPYGRIKSVFRAGSGNFKFIQFPPTWDTGLPAPGTPGNEVGPHYHVFHEWGYVLGGDYVIYEPVSPYQRNPVQYRYVEGTWLDRPGYTLHSGDWATGGIRSQNPSTLILFEEGDTGITILDPSGSSPPVLYGVPQPEVPDWRTIKFNHPLIIDSGSVLEWETDTQMAGRLVKWLSDDPVDGFRAQLVKIPPGWVNPAGTSKAYFENAHRIRYVLFGDMQVWSFDGPDSAGEATRVSENFFIYQPAGSIWGYGAGAVSEQGAVWLEVTYAKGLTVGGGPIEIPIAVE